MKKRIYLLFTCIISILLLTGCFTKKEITTEKFKEIAEKRNYQIADVIDQYSSSSSIKEATVARNQEKDFQIEFYVLDSEENATNMFNNNEAIFRDDESNKMVTQYKTTMPNYSIYKVTINGKYKYLCRVNKSFLYINADEENKTEIEEFVKEMGY